MLYVCICFYGSPLRFGYHSGYSSLSQHSLIVYSSSWDGPMTFPSYRLACLLVLSLFRSYLGNYIAEISWVQLPSTICKTLSHSRCPVFQVLSYSLSAPSSVMPPEPGVSGICYRCTRKITYQILGTIILEVSFKNDLRWWVLILYSYTYLTPWWGTIQILGLWTENTFLYDLCQSSFSAQCWCVHSLWLFTLHWDLLSLVVLLQSGLC